MNPSLPHVALVGCGGVARAHLRAVGADCIVALCDENPDAARRFAAELGVEAPIFASLLTLLESVQPFIVLVCTPPATHFSLVRAALEAGASVLCEKPLATRATEADALVALAARREIKLRTSAKYRFCAGVVAAKALLKSGETGALQKLQIGFGSALDWRRSWHGNVALSGGGVWMDNGPHALDLARFLAGELRFTDVEQWKCDGVLETEVALRFESASGAPVHIALSWERVLGEDFAALHCEHGTLSLGWRATVWAPHGQAPRELAGAYDKAACFSAQWRAFAEGDARWNAGDGGRTVALIQAVYEGK